MNSANESELSELLSLLGNDVAEAVRAHLPDSSRSAISQLGSGEGGAISARKRARLLGEFERFLQFVMTQSPQERTARDEPDPEAAAQQLEELGDDPLVILKRVAPERFAQCVRDEHPRTIAVALDSLPPTRVAELLGKLPPEICPGVVKELGKGIKVLPQIQTSLINALAKKIRDLPVEKPREDDHLKRLAEVVRAADRKQRRMLVDAIREQDEATAQRLMDLLYRFEDLMTLEDRAIQQILGQVDVATLAAAMVGAEATIADRVMKNLSRRAADMLKEELQFSGRTPASRVEQARDAIGKLIAKTEQEAE